MDTQEGSQLVLHWNDETWAVSVANATPSRLSLGRGAGVDVEQPQPFASRQHAYIEQRQQSFVLVDHSTNGTYLQTQDQQVVNVHRAEIRLWGEGYLSLGDVPSSENAIGFQLSMDGARR